MVLERQEAATASCAAHPCELARDAGAGWELVQRDWSLRSCERDRPGGAVGPRWLGLEAARAALRRLASLVLRCGAALSVGTRAWGR